MASCDPQDCVQRGLLEVRAVLKALAMRQGFCLTCEAGIITCHSFAAENLYVMEIMTICQNSGWAARDPGVLVCLKHGTWASWVVCLELY